MFKVECCSPQISRVAVHSLPREAGRIFGPALPGSSSHPPCSLLSPERVRHVRASWDLERGMCEPKRWIVMRGDIGKPPVCWDSARGGWLDRHSSCVRVGCLASAVFSSCKQLECPWEHCTGTSPTLGQPAPLDSQPWAHPAPCLLQGGCPALGFPTEPRPEKNLQPKCELLGLESSQHSNC